MRMAESERQVMNVLWKYETVTAKKIAEELGILLGWKKATVYTLITRCIEKGYLKRTDPHFVCTPLISKEEVSHRETDYLLEKDFDGSADLLVASLVSRKKLSAEKIRQLQALLDQMEEE